MAKLTFAEIRFWLKEAESCEARQKRELIANNNYPLLINYYEGKVQIKAPELRMAGGEKWAIICEHFPNTNALISELMYQNPDILAEATKPFSVNKMGQTVDVEAQAPLMKSALEYLNDKTQALIEYRIALFDMLYAGYCGIEIDHTRKEEGMEIPGQKELEEREQEGAIQKFIGKAKEVITGRNAQTEKEAEEKLAKEAPAKEEAYATPDKTYVRRWEPLDILFDWRAKRLKDRRYDLRKIRMSMSEFKALYPEFKDKIRGGMSIDYSRHQDQEHNLSVLLYMFQILKKGGEYWTLILNSLITDSEIDYFKRPYTTNGFNLKIGTLHKYGKIYPVSMAQMNKMLADEMNEYVEFMKEVAERNVPKFLVDRNKNVDLDALQSAKVNDVVEVNGLPETAVRKLEPTNVSLENKELIGMFEKQKEKGWGVTTQRLGTQGEPKFAEELKIQEAGFIAKQIDIQEGLRLLINEVNETGKDIIVEFWDGEYFFKITGGEKPEWYIPEVVNGVVVNPLSDTLTADYHIKIDITSALRPNKESRKKELILFIRELVNMTPLLQLQGKALNLDVIKRVADDFGLSGETLLIDLAPAEAPSEEPLVV